MLQAGASGNRTGRESVTSGTMLLRGVVPQSIAACPVSSAHNQRKAVRPGISQNWMLPALGEEVVGALTSTLVLQPDRKEVRDLPLRLQILDRKGPQR